jgi:predicted membrane chloride channel (bestrophin family)
MGDIPGHRGVGRYQVKLDDVQGETSGSKGGFKGTKFDYDPDQTIGNLLHWRGTVLPGLSTRPLIWLSLVIFLTGSICNRGFPEECGDYLPMLEGKELGTMGGLLTFFLAFYTSGCYNRFMTEYTHLKNIEGYMRSIGIMVRMYYHLPALEGTLKPPSASGSANWVGSPEHAAFVEQVKFRLIELFRYLGASYYMLFARLYEGERTYNAQTAFEEGLLTAEELDHLKDSSPSMIWFRLLTWAFQAVREMENNGMTAGHASKAENAILKMRETMNAVSYSAQMPVPLAYYHIITVLCIGFVLCYSYTCIFITTSSAALTWIVYAIPVFGFTGMREVAIAMSNPFGDDDTDLPVDAYVHNVMKFLVGFVEEKLDPTGKGLSFYNGQHWIERYAETHQERSQIRKVIQVGEKLKKQQIKGDSKNDVPQLD